MQLLKSAETYFREIVAPKALEIDCQPNALKEALQGMGDRSLLGLRVPERWGGTRSSDLDFYNFQMMVARYSGALAFLQAQHQSACALLAKSNNQLLRQEYLPRSIAGEVLVGVGFSQLRRQGTPSVKATPVAGGYSIAGEVPWASGFGLFTDLIIAGCLPDGKEIYAMIPFREMKEGKGSIRFSSLMELAAMSSTNTVSASLVEWFLPNERVLKIEPAGSIHQRDRENVLHHGFFALGCARAGLDIVDRVYSQKGLSFLERVFKLLDRELDNCREAMLNSLSSQNQFFEQKLQLRARSIDLAGRCSQAAVIAASGAANQKYHPAQRVYREALVFMVSGQTEAVMKATLEQLLPVNESAYN